MGISHLAGNNPANDPDSKPVKGRSTFKPNRSFYQTMPFGLNVPHFNMEAVEGDKISVRVGSDVDTYSLKAPLMTPVRMCKDYFFAPLRAVLPENAELLITNPLTGEDVDSSLVNTVVSQSRYHNMLESSVAKLYTSITHAYAAMSATTPSVLKYAGALLTCLTRYVMLVEPFVSYGSLLTHCGHSVGSALQFRVKDSNGITTSDVVYADEWFEALCAQIKTIVKSFKVRPAYFASTSSGITVTAGGRDFIVDLESDTQRSTGMRVSFSRFLEELRQGMFVYSISDVVLKDDAPTTLDNYGAIPYGAGKTFANGADTSYDMYVTVQYPADGNKYLNYGRLVAYQLSCAQFYTQDSIDYIYSTNLWHQNQRALMARVKAHGTAADVTQGWSFAYSLNGIAHQYDSVSGFVVDYFFNSGFFNSNTYFKEPAIKSLSGGGFEFCTFGDWGTVGGSTWQSSGSTVISAIGYINNLFGFTRSLKYRDYFCGSKPRPMAVGNVNVAVTSGEFSVVDVTKNIQIQRFLNQVNRTGRRFREYVQGIFGVTPGTDYHDCIFLGSTEDMIGAEETSNTGAAQLTEPQTTTSKLRKNSSHFAFEGQFAEPGYMIGITHFDVARPYVDSTDKCMMHVDRYDMFNPFMQQIGDQEVDGTELALWNRVPFGYQLRYSEYKQSFDRCAGAFATFLPGFAFLVDRSTIYPTGSADLTTLRISPDFIRSRSSEFDRFYISLTHSSLAGYFHFIIRHDIQVVANRAMEAAPSIL